ncbi:MAG: helix-turn-helix domain-containing protein [Verrucomicrobiota bacterium]|jgi:AraC family transcriptional activator of pobA
MKNYRPILLQDLAISLPGLHVYRVRLNHHAPEAVWTTHSHEHGQLLVYLSGRGSQTLGDKPHDCRPGSVVWVAPGTTHAFSRQMSRAPLVLVIDCDLVSTRATAHPCSQMPDASLARVRSALSRLLAVRGAEQREAMLHVGSLVLEILDHVLLAAGWLRPFNRFAPTRTAAIVQFTERLIERMDGPEVTLEAIAQRAGYQTDHLNRKLKAECGLTLGQLRARLRLRKAELLIRQGYPMSAVAERIGIPDNNYFSRWFRRQTGMTPSQFRDNPQPAVRL